jgi:hypothetical protein
MKTPLQYETFELSKNLNPVLKKGMQGVILEILDRNSFEVEFVNEDGTNIEFDGNATFTIDSSYFKSLWQNSFSFIYLQGH